MSYPLDPLSADEFTAVAAILKREHGFFDRNPALDVVGTPPDTCHTESTSAGH